jgi:hypothetical protein
MADVFQSCRLTLLRAQHHIDDLNAKIIEFVSSQPWSMAVEPNLQARENVVKVKFARRLSTDLPCILFDAANNLRAALDQAGYASAVASGNASLKRTNFPFGDTLADLDNHIDRRKGCRDLPPEITALFRVFRPYKGGNDALWALNKLCNAQKHCDLIPFTLGDVRIYDADGSNVIQGAIGLHNPLWDPSKYEIMLDRIPANESTPDYKAHVTLNVAIQCAAIERGKPAIAVLGEMMRIVDGILAATEAECRRIGLNVT